MVLPLLREELALLPGPTLADGQPSHTLHDPARNQYFQVGWPAFEVLCRWHLGDPGAIAEAITHDTTLHLDVRDVEDVVGFLQENQLLQPPYGSATEYSARLKAQRGGIGAWLLHNYLFFRVPIWRPDRWLTRWAGWFDFLYSKAFFYLTLSALALGLTQIYRQWDSFSATLVDTLTWPGMLSYGLALAAVKVLHELGHAVTAKRFGCRVPTMGLAFLVLWPVAYTDTNEVWKLTDKHRRLQVAAAGVAVELLIAIWATMAWGLMPEGGAKAIAFLLATTTWVSTIAINASPFLRFDGYFLLSDWLGMPNLHARAFALARWDLRERLFALGEPAPEGVPRQRVMGLVLFAYITWLYRLTVFLGIAALVYTFFIKAVGILLFIVEIGWFVLLPLTRELGAWRNRWSSIRNNQRAHRSGFLGLAALFMLFLPWPSRIAATGLLRPAEQFVIYAPRHAQVASMPTPIGGHVKEGELLLQFAAPDLESRQIIVLARWERLRWQASAGVFDSEQRAQWQLSQEQLATAEAELSSIQADSAHYAPKAPFSGVLRDMDPDTRLGTWLSAQEPVARLVADQGQVAIAYLDEDEISRVVVGDSATFFADGMDGPVLPLEIIGIDKDSNRTLPEAELSSLYGGGVLVREKKGVLYPEHSIYRVTLKARNSDDEAVMHSWRGKVVISGNWASPGWRYLRSGIALLWREAGF
ncbi:MAG: HlyD family efflux transporter periplasmic adaptor subunit [Deltaproteobacteria bacterium]|nr:HlyD family efflux transporter periplasmic adaptor subunit [Deltaproteobacteria bacterium]